MSGQEDLKRVREESNAAQKQRAIAEDADGGYIQIQGWFRDLELSLGLDIWIASNDQGRVYADGILRDGCLAQFPGTATKTPDSVSFD